jgi:hypothetical protein
LNIEADFNEDWEILKQVKTHQTKEKIKVSDPDVGNFAILYLLSLPAAYFERSLYNERSSKGKQTTNLYDK